VAIAGLATESSAFTPHRTTLAHFEVLRDQELLDLYQPWATISAAVDWVPLMRAVAPPGGPVVAADYAVLEAELLDRLARAQEAQPLDGVLLDLHGAMLVEGMEGAAAAAEEDLVAKIRSIVGANTVVAVGMDPHGNLSEALVELVDIATCHRHSPHIDHLQTRQRAGQLLVEAVLSGRRPYQAWVRVPILLSGERTSTMMAPGRALFIDAVQQALAQYRVQDASVWVGRAWGDEARCASAVLALGDDPAEATRCALDLAHTYWDQRDGFHLVAEHHGSWLDGLDFVLAGAPAPVVISDAGDNVTSGSAGDITYALAATRGSERFLASGKRILFAGLVDPAAVEAGRRGGVGAVVRRGLGAVVDQRFCSPVVADWTVEALVSSPAGAVVGALFRAGPIAVLAQCGRSPFVRGDDPAFSPGMLQDVAWCDASDYDVVVVKNGYIFPSQADLAGSWFLAITPGGSDLDFARLPYRYRLRPMYPVDTDFDPDLQVRLIGR
jgi:microcystin degradation protein MlrC